MSEILDGTVVQRKFKLISNKRVYRVEAGPTHWIVYCPTGSKIIQENKATTATNLLIGRKKIEEIYGPVEEVPEK